ncbi:MAG: pilin N-terminal domain-containing protein [Peptoniphilus harei]
MNKKKILSLIMALVMLVGVFSPLTALAADGTTNLKIHKVELDDFDGVTEKDHKGQELTLEQLGGKNYFEGKNPKWLQGVKFTYWKVTTEQLAEIEKTNPKTVDQMQALIDAENSKLAALNGTETAATDKDGLVTISNLADGTYYFVESETPANHTGAMAVPFKITLPIYDDNGAKMNDVNIYPKNTTDEKDTTKELDKVANKAETHNVTITQNGKDEVYTLDKGAKVPYIVKTPIPAGSKEIILAWSDRMSEGLTYNDDVVITATYGEDNKDLGLDANDYTAEKSGNGFVLKLTDSGIKKVLEKTLNKGDGVKLIDGKTVYNKQANEAAQKVEFTLKYSATLNGLTGPVDPETNTVSFHYGNKPGYTPQPGDKNPIPEKDKTEINVDKSFVNGDGTGTQTWPENMTISLKLEKWDPATNKWEEVAGKALTLDSTNTSGKFDGLNKNEKYRVVEQEVKGWVPNYSHDENGDLVIKNKKNPNPNPITPPEVTVTSGGYRFVKTDDNNTDINRLVGGKFLINKDKEYLYYKTAEQLTQEQTALKKAEKDLQTLVDQYNALSAEEQEGQTGTDKKAAIDAKATEIAGLKKKASIQYEWKEGFGTKDNLAENLVVLTPNSEGFMEITGLDFGDYNLHEIEAPKGYAIPADGQKFPFTVNKDSYNSLNLESENKMVASTTTDTTNAQRLVNKKVTIPQTGGMGTVLFTIVGISLMAGAVVAMKRNREEA